MTDYFKAYVGAGAWNTLELPNITGVLVTQNAHRIELCNNIDLIHCPRVGQHKIWALCWITRRYEYVHYSRKLFFGS